MSALGGIIGAGMDFVGGLIGQDQQNDRDASARQANERAQERQNAFNAELQREFAKNGIRWRVEDAKAAGLHPLYSLTGNLPGGAPTGAITIDGGGGDSGHMSRALHSAGQNISRAVTASQDEHMRNLHKAQLLTLEAQAERDFAQASFYRTQAARAGQADGQSTAFPSDVVTDASQPADTVQLGSVSINGRTRVEAHPLYKDAVKLQPDEMTSRHASVAGQTAGDAHPFTREFEAPGGFRMLLPATGGGGVPEEIDLSMVPMLLGANLQKYGWRWVVDLMGYMTGRSPEDRQGRTLESWLRREFSNEGIFNFRRSLTDRKGLK